MIVFAPGTFDFYHKGHIELVDWAIEMEPELLVVLINGDKLLTGRKATHQDENTRKKNVEEYLKDCGVRHKVLILHSLSEWLNIAAMWSPCYMLHGDDHNVHTLSEIYDVDTSWWGKNNVRLIFKGRYPGVSSTELREDAKKSR